MKKRIIIILLLLVLLIPLPLHAKDGGSFSIKSLTYEIIHYHKIDENNANPHAFEVGYGVKIFGFEVYKNTHIEIEE